MLIEVRVLYFNRIMFIKTLRSMSPSVYGLEVNLISITEVVKIYSHINISVVLTHAFTIK